MQAIVGGTALATLLFTLNQQQITNESLRRGQVGERFSRAVEQLGHESMDVRLGGLYELQQLALDPPRERLPTIVEVLSAYIRQHAQPENDAVAVARPPPPADAAAALRMVRRLSNYEAAPTVDLRRVNFSHLDLARWDLEGVDLSLADLRCASLDDAHLRRATLVEADLRGAILQGADLSNVNLDGAKADSTTVWPVNFQLNGAGVEVEMATTECEVPST